MTIDINEPDQPTTPVNRRGRPRSANRAVKEKRTAAPRTVSARSSDDGFSVDNTRPPMHAAPRLTAEDDAPLRRRTRSERQESRFGVPQHLKTPGWDYQFWVTHVLGQPASRSEMTDIYQGGWRPVRTAEMPEMMPPGDPSEFVEEGGQRLFKRPMTFTKEAQAEERSAALETTSERVKAASRGANGDMDINGVRAVPLGMDMQAEAGSYNTPGR